MMSVFECCGLCVFTSDNVPYCFVLFFNGVVPSNVHRFDILLLCTYVTGIYPPPMYFTGNRRVLCEIGMLHAIQITCLHHPQ